jgi:hypothetical protein
MKEDKKERLAPTVLRAELSRLNTEQPSVHGAIPPDTSFKSHLKNVVSFLNKIGSMRNLENNQLQSFENVRINSDSLIYELHQYVVRSCL